MGQYHPDYEVGQIAKNASQKYIDINCRPESDELARAYDTARNTGLWRFDERWVC